MHKACAAGSVLLMVDVQTRLISAMSQADQQAVERHCGQLLQAARLLDVPILLTEQYPKGLGATVSTLQVHSEHAQRFEKTAFSCWDVPELRVAMQAISRPQVVVCGMESHICIAQTVLDLLPEYAVFVVEDAICAQHAADHNSAVRRMQQAGAQLLSTQALVFEWLRDAQHDAFKPLTRLLQA